MGNENEAMALLRHLVNDFHEVDNWDQPPTLGLLIRGPEGDLRFVPYEFQENLWGLAPPWAVLLGIAMGINQPDHPPEPIAYEGEVEGTVFLSEGWGLDIADLPEEERDQAVEWAQENSIADSPYGFETYMASAVLWPDHPMMATRPRNTDHVVEVDGADHLDGRITDGLRAVLRAVHPE